MSLRTFIAVELDVPILAGLVRAQGELASVGGKINWVARANLHVTMNFLGDVADEAIAEVCRRMAAAAGRVEPFEFAVRGLACTPSHGPVRMIWGLVDDPSGLLAVLHDELANQFASMGLRQENREYRPHVTLARVKYVENPARLRGAVRAFADTEFGAQHGEELVAFTSTLTKEGPIYAPLARAGLGK
ncbi:MAG: RNA 2',3'-cyclic phosphodiesterase [Phycisphaerae bacterium]|nr:RNA 2',3'-cyclic phosphodiesterase [Phycisphaerae bacterium]